jgi:CysZ protein
MREALSVPRAVLRALGQLGEPVALLVLLGCLTFGVALFGLLWWLVPYSILKLSLIGNPWLDTGLALIGSLGIIVLTWFLFPPIAIALVGLFLEPIANAVERRHYPHLPPAQGIPLRTSVWRSSRLLLLLVVGNVAILVLLVFPPLYLVAYYIVNGLLLGREYAELVALRRSGESSVDALLRGHRGSLAMFGVLAALAATMPIINIIAPIVLTAAMVHLVVGWSGPTSSGHGPSGRACTTP